VVIAIQRICLSVCLSLLWLVYFGVEVDGRQQQPSFLFNHGALTILRYTLHCCVFAVGKNMSPVSSLVVMSFLLATTAAQERFQFCGGRDLIHAVIRVCSRSLPDELAPPTERTTTSGEFELCCVQNPLHTFPRNFHVAGKVANLLRTC